MYELTVRTSFAAAHYLKDHDGPCARMHGHTWQVEVTLKGGKLDHRGMLLDFQKVKNLIKTIVEDLDHQCLNELEPFNSGGEKSPTAENLARYIYERLEPEINNQEHSSHVALVRVWESPDASASFMRLEGTV